MGAAGRFALAAAEKIASVPLTLSLSLTELRGVGQLWLPPAPADCLWVSYREVPEMVMSAKPSIGARGIGVDALGNMVAEKVSKLIAAKIKEQIASRITLPTCLQVRLPGLISTGLRFRSIDDVLADPGYAEESPESSPMRAPPQSEKPAPAPVVDEAPCPPPQVSPSGDGEGAAPPDVAPEADAGPPGADAGPEESSGLPEPVPGEKPADSKEPSPKREPHQQQEEKQQSPRPRSSTAPPEAAAGSPPLPRAASGGPPSGRSKLSLNGAAQLLRDPKLASEKAKELLRDPRLAAGKEKAAQFAKLGARNLQNQFRRAAAAATAGQRASSQPGAFGTSPADGC